MLMVGMIMYMFGGFTLIINQSHILMVLLCLEFMYLGILYTVVLLMSFSECFVSIIVFMILVVCEAGLGLSILVMSVFFYGNDKLSAISILKCW
uniref:NADH dehydrogenase subunit 4L n=1 Tax=Ornithodoros erraticus TaxID=265619 RepID=UPI001CEE8E23|nr:NADH dehydrogenase subunit 4L [Ornithodoros erraticus]UYB78284.1 NADH dehydrogenase subunit 4L [Ornithodoros erraticus]UYB78297.1 NADH dehydrogenase subunit 4L [Ornithodoros erraticus]